MYEDTRNPLIRQPKETAITDVDIKCAIQNQMADVFRKAYAEKEKETAKVMKFKQWQLRPVKEPKTLADVHSSREKPVLCWATHDAALLLIFEEADGLWIRTRTGGVVRAEKSKDQYTLYQPSTPAYTLGTLPDYRVIVCSTHSYFRLNGEWYAAVINSEYPKGFDRCGGRPIGDFVLTPYEAYLETVDLGGAK